MKVLFKVIIPGILFLVLIFFGTRFYFLGKQSQEMSSKLGLIDQHLQACGNKPNCVSTQSKASNRWIEPLSYSGDWSEAKRKLTKVAQDLGGSLTKDEDRYLHFEFKSKIFRFVDDTEFYFPEDSSTIEMRSESRVGYSDLGANKKRLDSIRESFSSQSL